MKSARVQLAKEYVESNQCEVMDTTMAHEQSFLAGWAARGKADTSLIANFSPITPSEHSHSVLTSVYKMIEALDE